MPIPTLVWLSAAAGSLAVPVVAALRGLPAFYVDDGVLAINLLTGKGFTQAFHGPEALTAAHAPFQPFVLAAIHGLLGVGWMGVAGVVGNAAVVTPIVSRPLRPPFRWRIFETSNE